eukprot:scaffold48_cov311-Pinguiococcus_pyrenoidosus.AAC.317
MRALSRRRFTRVAGPFVGGARSHQQVHRWTDLSAAVGPACRRPFPAPRQLQQKNSCGGDNEQAEEDQSGALHGLLLHR